MSFIPYGKQEISQVDIDSVIDVLKSDFLTQGPQVPTFENSLISACGAKYAFAVNSATSALHISCLALDLGPGDYLWTSPITFVATANCGLYCGASIDFVDIDPDTYNMCPAKLESKLKQAKAEGTLPKVVVVVHLCGQPCDMEKIYQLSKQYGFKIIEDASHAIGARYQNSITGDCKYSDITIFSFHPVKIVTTAEGGAALTNNDVLAKKLELLRSHGITRDESLMTEDSHGGWYYQQIALGYNYRMTEMQAALGVSQMTRLTDFVERRNQLAIRYDNELKHLPIELPKRLDSIFSSFHLYIIRLKLNEIKLSHKEVFSKLRRAGLGVNLHYIPVHLQPYYQKLGFKVGDFPEAEKYYGEAISIPIFHAMTDEQQSTSIETISQVLS
ncbi:MAG: UDP-4-amino-4,6-dideoxy-N-acetyl-beta-L-altrosamine transaminase [Oleiphilaceae bacterium]|nr:UDP-4-amino-4,6-dideoxy-N-acetyl-beta-L-altrosamine transaminase [Oleiphilaceae bacterium]